MFGSNKKTDSAKPGIIPAPATNALNSLVHGTFMEGKIKASSDIRIDGTLKGDLDCDAKIIIGPSGVIEGTIRCKNAVIEGRFEGVLNVAELLQIRETAKVTGEVSYGNLVVQSGAVINGSYKVTTENRNNVPGNSSGAKQGTLIDKSTENLSKVKSN